MDLAHDEAPSETFGEDGSGLLRTDGRTMPVKFHPLAELFPMIEGAEMAALVEDVQARGVRRAVVMLDGMILDGRNRYMAAREAAVGYPVVEFTGDDPVGFVISENLRRRHMSESQRAMVGGRLAKMPRGGDRRSDQTADLRNGPTAAVAAQQLNVSPRMIETARTVVRDGAPALVAAVDAGTVSVSAAAEVAKLPEAVQAEIVADGPDAVRETAKVIRDDASTYEKLKAGDPETVAAIREQIIDAVTNPAPRAPRPSRANPIHEPNPAYDAANLVIGSCETLTAAINRKGPAFVIEGFLDAAMRARSIAKFKAAQAALAMLMEAINAD